MNRFTDKVVIVTGAASGIGKASAQRIASEGGVVACMDIQEDALSDAVNGINNNPDTSGAAFSYVCDIGDPESTMVEVGDLFFAVVNVARHLDIDPESALRSAVFKFRARVEGVTHLAASQGLEMASLSASELDELWEVVKSHPTH